MRVGMADGDWIRRLRHRFDDFEATTRRAGVACSLKWRVVRGRFDRESAPEAYRLIETAVRRGGAFGGWLEAHGNGPELLVYLVPTPDGFALGGNVAVLLTELANARSEGVRLGDPAAEALDLIVRRFDRTGRYVEQTLMSLPPPAVTTPTAVAIALRAHGIEVRGE